MPVQRSETEHINELYQLKGLLKIEKQADYEYFKTLILNKPLEIRRAEGFTWYPVVVTQSGYTYGDRAYVVIERGGSVDVPHQFRSGNVVNLFTQQSDVYQAAYSGTVQYINKNTMRIVLNTKDLPDWLSGGSIGADMLFDEKTYIEMEKALEKIIHAKRNRLAELRDILLGHRLPDPYSVNAMSLDIPNLNPSQNAAIRDILANKDVAIIHGPPGTGKTTTLVQAIKRLCAIENTVLVTAPSNTATDLLTEKLALEGLRVVRLGNISRVDESVVRHTLESQLSNHPESKNIKKVKIKAAELRRNARAFKRRFDHEARTKRDKMLGEAKDLAAWANDLEQRLIDQLLDSADVITCTPVGAAHSILDNRMFRTVVIDEAAQALEPATWIPILKASKIVLAGDPFQLPPTVKSNEARQGGLAVTLLEKALIRLPDTNLLNVQYRMNEVIMNFSNAWFYQGVLKAAPSVAHRELPYFQDEKPVVFVDTIGCSFDEQLHPENLSKFNPEEFCVLREHLYQLMELFPYEKPTIGIISPYREQVLLMEKEISEDPLLKDLPITVQTIDGFQGQERDVIYISLVRSNEHAEIGFLADYRRMNVAMTRAKMKLVVIGDSGTIGKNRFYQHFLDYCELKASYRTAWEFMKP